MSKDIKARWNRFLCRLFGHKIVHDSSVICWFVTKEIDKCARSGCGYKRIWRKFWDD